MWKLLTLVSTSSAILWAVQATCPHGIIDNGVDQNGINAIIGKHNEVRLRIAHGQVPGQPRGVNLKRLKWDNYLAATAQNIANTCVFAHASVHDDRFYVGQNLAGSSSTALDHDKDWNGVVESWFNEYSKYKYPDDSTKDTGHYTQVVWANTEYVGCGYSLYETDDPKWKYSKLYVCNYGPGGNIVGQAPYQTGSSGCENLC